MEIEGDQGEWDSDAIRPRYTLTAPSPSSSLNSTISALYDDHQRQQLESRSLEALELVLQKILRSLGALADNFDRILSSYEAAKSEGGGSWCFRALRCLGEGAWRRLRGFGSAARDPNALWLCGILLLLVFFLLAGSRPRPPPSRYNSLRDQVPPKRIQLPDGRNISYREEGVPADEARHAILVVHGFLSSRLAGIPGINSSLLERYGIRLVAYDLPGFGGSDPHPGRSYNSSAWDMVGIADALNLGDKFWLLAFAGGGPHAWAAIHYIPERLAGVAMVAPAGNPYGGNLTHEEAATTWKVWSFRRKLLHFCAKRFPSLLPGFLRRTLMQDIDALHRSLYYAARSKDRSLFEQQEFMRLWEDNVREFMKQQRVYPMVQELLLLVNSWGFDMGDLKLRRPSGDGFMSRMRGLLSRELSDLLGFQRPIHIWHGTDDVVVPLVMSEFAKRVLPRINFHKLQGEGHFSWFYLCDKCHADLLHTLFGEELVPA